MVSFDQKGTQQRWYTYTVCYHILPPAHCHITATHWQNVCERCPLSSSFCLVAETNVQYLIRMRAHVSVCVCLCVCISPLLSCSVSAKATMVSDQLTVSQEYQGIVWLCMLMYCTLLAGEDKEREMEKQWLRSYLKIPVKKKSTDKGVSWWLCSKRSHKENLMLPQNGELNMPSGGLNTVRTPRMSWIMLSNFHWSAITLIDIWSPVAYFSGLILWLWVISWRGILAHLSKYFLKMVQISFFF